ncbi:hypothetical protein ABZS86_16530 [Streptomyces sp. NPDC005355]|uniref:hypothetical protein n=1 Tax=Streptomyces sp. NPDC005355 TaxID=3157038 RepID=UPI0033AD3FCC
MCRRWAGQLPDGTWAVALFNRSDATRPPLPGPLGARHGRRHRHAHPLRKRQASAPLDR